MSAFDHWPSKLVIHAVRLDRGRLARMADEMHADAGGTPAVQSFAMGVPPNIAGASFEALTDSICYKLYCDGAPA